MSPHVDEVDYNLLSNIYEHTKITAKCYLQYFPNWNELPDGKDVEDKEEQKKKMEENFKKRGVGKPRGTFEEKQKQYFEMVKAGKIKNPVAKTLIMRDERGEYIINILPK